MSQMSPQLPADYTKILQQIKERVQSAQLRAAVKSGDKVDHFSGVKVGHWLVSGLRRIPA